MIDRKTFSMNRLGSPPVGIEPTTFRLEGGRTIRCAKGAFLFGCTQTRTGVLGFKVPRPKTTGRYNHLLSFACELKTQLTAPRFELGL